MRFWGREGVGIDGVGSRLRGVSSADILRQGHQVREEMVIKCMYLFRLEDIS